MGIVIAVLIFGLMVIVHELGHFLLAKKNGIGVEEFSIGMGLRLFSFERGGTRYSLKLLPLGGSCAMKGELEDAEGEDSFQSKSVGKRISVVIAGPLFNFFLAFVAAVILVNGMGFDVPEVLKVPEGSPAAEAGLQEGDIIKEYNGTSIYLGRDLDLQEYLYGVPAEGVDLTVLRNGEKIRLHYTPQSEKRYMLGFNYYETEDPAELSSVELNQPLYEAGLQAGDVITAIDGQEITSGTELGAYFDAHPMDGSPLTVRYSRRGSEKEVQVTPMMTEHADLGFYYNYYREKSSDPIQILKYSALEVRYSIVNVFSSLKMFFTGQVGIDDFSGPVGIVNVVDTNYEAAKSQGTFITWMSMLNLLILLSANLGIVNLLPIPGLDGGRLVFLILELIRGKRVKEETEGAIHFAGMMLMLALIVYVTFHDFVKFF